MQNFGSILTECYIDDKFGSILTECYINDKFGSILTECYINDKFGSVLTECKCKQNIDKLNKLVLYTSCNYLSIRYTIFQIFQPKS